MHDAGPGGALVVHLLSHGFRGRSSRALYIAAADSLDVEAWLRGLVHRFVASFFGEVATYLRDDGRRKAARASVAELIATTRPRVVLAHSLGSVVAYEALWARPDLGVELLITLGSPLGMPDVVFDRLDPLPNGRGVRPPGVTRWVTWPTPAT